MSFRLWKSEEDDINLGSPFAVFDVFKELAKIMPARDERQFPDLLAIPQLDDEELDAKTLKRLGQQARAALKQYGPSLSSMAKDLLRQLVRETSSRRPNRPS